MRDRFTRASRHGRGGIAKAVRREVYKRDNYTCQFCGQQCSPAALTIDHLVPVSRGGLDEITNYVTCCRDCNERKADMPLDEFAKTIRIHIPDLPVHGDPIVDNIALPIQIRLLRKRIHDRYRHGGMSLSGSGAQKKLEKAYRRRFWETREGKALEKDFPSLPGHARIMVPEIKAIVSSEREFWLLVELAKSANTRNLIGTTLTAECSDIEERFRSSIPKTRDQGLRKRMEQALARFERRLRELTV